VQLPGQHNLQNILMAVACAQAASIPTTTIAQAVRDFKGVAHRLETLGTIEGVAFINDSKATNYEASIVALQAMSQPVILLAGGRKKEGSPEAWLQEVQRKALAVVLYGEAGPIFAEYLSDFGYNAFQVCTTLDEAVTLAWSQVTAQGAVPILLSPACASYDQFANFEARGNRFRQIFEAMGT
jgi:UDP-N-acetylmuramoylalanine--D-glutamate ligase